MSNEIKAVRPVRDIVIHLEHLTLIPDIVMVEIERGDAEFWGALTSMRGNVFGRSERLYRACNKALAKENK